ncbi:MAG: phosphatidate cytidylyltransferase [Christensenellaceae bacterium]|jgi:phosphatidate cytidylyltransferase
MGKRILVAIPIVIVVALAVILQGWVLALFAVLLAVFCGYEIVHAMNQGKKPVLGGLSIGLSVFLAGWFLLAYGGIVGVEPFALLLAFIIYTMLCFVVAMFSSKHSMESVTNSVFAMIYPNLFWMIFYWMILTGQGGYTGMLLLLLMVFVPAMFCDTAAYFFGSAFGRHKLCPAISPKKTVEGSIGGFVGGVVGAGVVYLVLSLYMKTFGAQITLPALPVMLLWGAVLAAVSQIGDLAASFIKRSLNIKDFGKILPGHGGILDRMDSILFCIPVVYLFAITMMA